MQSRHSGEETAKTLHRNDIITCIYLPAMLYFLYNTNLFLNLGKYGNIYVLIIVASCEILKHLYYLTKSPKNVRKLSIKVIANSFLLFNATIACFYVIAVLFGAPIFSSFEETFMFALLLGIVTVLPSLLYLGPDATIAMLLSITMYEGEAMNNNFMLKMRMSLFGAWLGAVPIPLDWNRPWQQWPITCCIGALVGFALAHFVTAFHWFGRGKSAGGRKTSKVV